MTGSGQPQVKINRPNLNGCIHYQLFWSLISNNGSSGSITSIGQMLYLFVGVGLFSTTTNRQPRFESQPNNTLCSCDDCNINIIINTYASLLQASTNNRLLPQGKLLHAHINLIGLSQNVLLGTKLVTMYAFCRSMEDARQVFDRITERNSFLYNMMIRGYACNGPCEEAFFLYDQMQRAGIQPDNFTFPFVLKACATLADLQEGKLIHGHIVQTGFESNVFVGNALVAMYAKCGHVDSAKQFFDRMPRKDVTSWNTLIAGYTQNGLAIRALTLFWQMQLVETAPDQATIVSVIQACADLAALQQGRSIHGYIIRNRFEVDISVGNSLVAMYSKCESVEVARKVFNKMPKKDVVSWNAMITGYAQNRHPNKSLSLFHQMQLEGVKPNQVTVVSVLPACANLAALQQGKDIHDYVMNNKLESDASVVNSLIAMYAKCGRTELARPLFDKMSKRNVVSWNAMIAGYAQNGHADEALTLFHLMQYTDMKPDLATIVSVIPACAHLAALQQGKMFHAFIIRSGFGSNVLVETALVDMYSKCGIIAAARKVFDKMSERNVVSWSAMIAGYGMHGLAEDALALFIQMKQEGMNPDHITFTHVLSACSYAGLVDEGWQYFDCMRRDYFIKPTMDHYACMVDLLGRAGHLNEAQEFIKKMPIEPNASVWGALLGACRIHSNIDIGKHISECIFDMEPKDAGNYVLSSNIYAAAGRWDDVAKVRKMMKDRGLRKTPGRSLIEVNNKVHAFCVGDRSHPQSEKIYAMMEILSGQMKEAGYIPKTDFVLHDMEDEMKEHM